MSNTILQVRDLDAVKTLRPLAFGLTGRFISGVPAILRRVLYQWHRAGLLELEGQSFSPIDRAALANRLEREGGDVDFVGPGNCSVRLRQDPASGDLTITATVRLEDGRTYPLEVVASAARGAILQLGGQTA
jgi:hypothetical protein